MNQHEYPLFVINAFTKGPFSGNPAAVCLVRKDQDPSDYVKQKLAAEMNLSETAYVTTIHDKDDFSTASRFGLRWFTPTTEVKLCGHATLASSAVIFNCIGNTNQVITFNTLSGELTVRKTADGKFSMDFPSNKPDIQDQEEIKHLIEASQNFEIKGTFMYDIYKNFTIITFSVVIVAVGTLPYQDVNYSSTTKKLLIRLDDKVNKTQLQNHIVPINLLLQAHDGQKILGIILTLKGSSENNCISDDGKVYDFVSRYFTPWQGIDEDPVTGSAHTVLAPYWAEFLEKRQLFACQCSKRSGQLWLDTSTKGRVEITGDVFAFIKGSVCIQ